MSKMIYALAILGMFISLAVSAPTNQKDIENFTKDVSKNLTYYLIAGAVILVLIVGLLCWTAAKGCCCIIKLVLLVGLGLGLFFVITKGTIDYTNS